MAQTNPEPWLRGPIQGVHAFVMPVFFTFTQVREELASQSAGLSHEQVWRKMHGTAPLGFHIKHIAGSVDRLTTYLLNRQLNEEQMQFMREEVADDSGLDGLLGLMNGALDRSEKQLREIDPASLCPPKQVFTILAKGLASS